MSTTRNASGSAPASEYRIDRKSPLAGGWRYPGGVGALGLGMAIIGYRSDPRHFAFAYLFAFFVALSLALGSLFFVLVLYVTKANWGIAVRRIAEFFMRPMAVFAILVIPLVLSTNKLFPWAGASGAPLHGSTEQAGESHESPLADSRGDQSREPAAMRDLPVANVGRLEKAAEQSEAKIVDHKRPYLNLPFFFIRLIAYLAVWTFVSQRYFRWSVGQDKTRALENTASAQRLAPVALILFGTTLTFFAFDWLLSLDATWYSTIFGVYIFSQCALFHMACLILMTLFLRRSGALGDAVTVEHFHDLGKLLFGWIVFWSYIAFAQFFLQWYSNIPDEVAWFHKRWDENGGQWMGVSLALVLFHFAVPFWFLMSRNIKRRLPLLAIGAVCMVLMHIADAYWIVMPNFGPFAPGLLDLACLMGIVGVYLAAVMRGMEDYPLIPIGDPRLTRSLEFENA